MDEVVVRTIAEGLQAAFEAVNEVAKGLSEERQERVNVKSKRILQARIQLHALLDERR